jgi:hypothetical protein
MSAGGISDDGGYDIALDSAGNAYILGFLYSSIANFGPHSVPTSGYTGVFAAKLDPDGNWLWAVRAIGTSWNEAGGIAVDQEGNAYLTGQFYASISFGSYTLVSSGLMDAFAAKLDSEGNWLWAVRGGGDNFVEGYGIAVDQAGSAYLTGSIGGTASFGSYTLNTCGSHDVFAAKLDSEGNWLWAVSAGGAGWDQGMGIAVDQAGNTCLAGKFRGTASFGPHDITANAYSDIFVVKLGSATSVDDACNLPGVEVFALKAQPNPFSATTRITFRLKQSMALELAVYNLRGQRVRTLLTGSAGIGEHSVNWDGRDDQGRNLPPGVYLYRLHGGGENASGKLILVK